MAEESKFQPDGQLIDVWHIRRGSTFTRKYVWRTSVGTPKNIGGISAAVAAVVNAPAHGLQVGATVMVQKVVGSMASLVNDSIHTVSAVTADHVTLPTLNTTGLAYASGGRLIELTPVDLTGWTGDSQVRDNAGAVLLEPTVTLGGAAGTIEIALTRTVTAAIADTVKKGVFDVELTQTSTDYVKNFAGGAAQFYGEQTK
jgi:hypothetical protein